VLVVATGEPRLTLKQKLALFDPERQRGEAMATIRIGYEAVEGAEQALGSRK
jgi:hypothetical protein